MSFSYSFRYSFFEMNKFLTSKKAVLVFRSKLDVSENKYTCALILKRVNIIHIWKQIEFLFVDITS